MPVRWKTRYDESKGFADHQVHALGIAAGIDHFAGGVLATIGDERLVPRRQTTAHSERDHDNTNNTTNISRPSESTGEWLATRRRHRPEPAATAGYLGTRQRRSARSGIGAARYPSCGAV